MFLGFGQDSYEFYNPPVEDVTIPLVYPTVEEHAQAERAAAISEVGYSFQPTVIGSAPTTVSSGFLPVLQNVVSGAASVISKFFDVQAAKTQAAAVQQQTAALRAAGLYQPVPGVQTAGFNLGGSWPILAIIGIGAFLVLKGKGGAAPEKKRRRRK